MRVNVDTRFYDDPRAKRAAEILRIGIEQLVGAVTRVWGVALTRVDATNPRGLVSRTDADYISDLRASLVDAMLATDLARIEVEGFVYFSGLEERAAFLLKQRRNGGKGGRPGKPTQSQRKASGNPTVSTGIPNANPWASLRSGSGSGSGSENQEGDPSRGPEPLKLTPSPVARGKRAPVEGMQECVADFHERYRARVPGSNPTWGPAQGNMMRRLIEAHGAAEVRRRIRVLFTAPPAFLATSTPDLATLAQHFDKLAAPALPSVPRTNGPTATSVTSPVKPYQPPTVAEPVDPAEVRSLADGLLANLRRGGGSS